MKHQNQSVSRRPPNWWLSVGVLAIAFATTPPHILHLPANPSSDWVDGLRGFLTGIGIGIELCVVIRLVRFRRDAETTAIHAKR